MSKDISRILEGWDYNPDEVVVRVVEGDDGREKVQLRLDLGLLQMEVEGRPDGQRPHGYTSLLEYYEAQEQAARAKGENFELDPEACGQLWQEGIQYYHRYLSFWFLKRYEACARDTARNLRLFAFVRRHARDERLVWQFDQFRPYVLMMNARAVATPLIESGQIEQGLQVIESAIAAIEKFLEEYDLQEQVEQCVELNTLRQWREEILTQNRAAASARPGDVLEVLHRKLQEAVAAEAFEEAALLRDEIRRLTNQDINTGLTG